MTSFADYEIEERLIGQGYKYIVGIDEAGRGPLAGPVTAAAVRIPIDFVPELCGKVKDSKKLSAKKRDELYDIISKNCDVGVCSISNRAIDDINILEATKLAMVRALRGVSKQDFVLIDGTIVLKSIDIPQSPIIKGDSKSVSIAAASIIAKVVRDEIIKALHNEFPVYQWDKNKGYGTKAHIEAIQTYGPCKYHRFTFNKVK